jgi:hypothetical protein
MTFSYVALIPKCYIPHFLSEFKPGAGISRVCTGFSNSPDIFRYTHFLQLTRRTLSLRIPWGEPIFT